MTDQNDADGFSRIQPVSVKPERVGAVQDSAVQDYRPAPANNTVKNGLLISAVLLLLALLLVVFLWLPDQVAQNVDRQAEPEKTTAAADADRQRLEQDTPELADPGVVTTETLLAQRQQAQTLSSELQSRMALLEDQSVMRWASAAFGRLKDRAVQARSQFDQRQYVQAIQQYRAAIGQADALLEQGGVVLAEALERGGQALQTGNTQQAASHFDLALAIDAGNTQARKGARRAAVLDEVLALLATAQEHERSGNYRRAAEGYQQAMKLDSDITQARQGLQRVNAILAQREYESSLSAGMRALENSDYAAASRAFQTALKMRPAAAEAEQGLEQARAGLETQTVQALQRQALASEASEQWARAAEHYRSALKIDPSLNFASEGLKRSEYRAQLDSRLRQVIASPQRLYTPSVAEVARTLLAEARRTENAGPLLQQQITQMDSALQAASQPIQVQLTSDNRTEVLIYHVGRIGTFTTHSLQLTPGDYTVIGRCEGYRDVRLNISVSPDQKTIGPIDIRCKDKI